MMIIDRSMTNYHLTMYSGAVARSLAYYGHGTIPILLDNVGCRGTESQLIDCTYDSNTLDCSHREDAGVTCQPLSSSGFYLHNCFV